MFKNLLCSVHNAVYSIKTGSFSIMLLRKNKGEGTGRQVSWVVKKSFRLTKLKIEDEIDNMQTQN